MKRAFIRINYYFNLTLVIRMLNNSHISKAQTSEFAFSEAISDKQNSTKGNSFFISHFPVLIINANSCIIWCCVYHLYTEIVFLFFLVRLKRASSFFTFSFTLNFPGGISAGFNNPYWSGIKGKSVKEKKSTQREGEQNGRFVPTSEKTRFNFIRLSVTIAKVLILYSSPSVKYGTWPFLRVPHT